MIGRFINADSHVNANGDLIGYNMYAYCSNNPVMYTDPSGEGLLSTVLILGVLFAIVLNLSSCEASTINDSYDGAKTIVELGENTAASKQAEYITTAHIIASAQGNNISNQEAFLATGMGDELYAYYIDQCERVATNMNNYADTQPDLVPVFTRVRNRPIESLTQAELDSLRDEMNLAGANNVYFSAVIPYLVTAIETGYDLLEFMLGLAQ